ncbi:RICIN domain-containing protein [uncultured Microbacterium sp.]|uniref:RICIN domain-containing protein n=1 Tax=uncultured Microbacterium sp. TaxID=191216 RepID=UPI0028D7C6D5|nr:RICIN domain-containing protein [uncultured Microbacterium sp.]
MYILLAVVLLLPLAATPAQAIGESTFTNPIAPDTADPTIEFYDGNYYMVATTWDNRVVMRKAPTLEGLGTTKPVVVYSDTNVGRDNVMWAPELKRLNGPNGWRWYLMYTMSGVGTEQNLQVIESAADDPMGPYTWKGRPLATTQWNIDGSYMELNGELFMVWSMFTPEPNRLQSNFISRMTNPWTAVGPMNILSQPVEQWETIGGAVNEGPIALQKNGKTWITYSASGCWTPDYQLGTLEYVGAPADPAISSSWVKSAGPVFSKANGAFGTGHNDFFNSPDGSETWNLYHANDKSTDDCGRVRSARAQIVNWTAAGEPDFGVPQATTTALKVPSGENAPITARVEGASWTIKNRSSGLCATVSATEAGDGAAIVQGSCDAPRAQWKLDTTGDNFLRLVNASSGKSLRPSDCASADGTPLQQAAWQTTSCQQWSLTNRTEGYSTLTNRTTGKALDSGLGTSGAGISIKTANASSAQDWVVLPSGPVSVGSVASGKVFDLPSCSTADGAVLQQHEFVGSPCQRVTFVNATGSSAEMHPASASDKCLSVAGGSTADAAPVTQGVCGVTGSAWRVLPKNDGTVEFRAVHSGKALDLSYCSTADNARLAQYTAFGNDCQSFRIMTGAADPLATLTLQPSLVSRCIAGKVTVIASVKNADDAPADITITTAYGSKTVKNVGGGKSTSATFATRQPAIAAGTASFSGAVTDDAARTNESAAAVPAASCS